jgi:hypothetical protein
MLDNFADETHAQEWLNEFDGKAQEYAHCFNIVRNKLFGEFDSNTQVNVHIVPVIRDITNLLIANTNRRIVTKYKEIYPDYYGTI